MYDAVPNGEIVSVIPSGAYFTVTKRLTSGQQQWGYVPDFNGHSGWVLLDSNVDLVRTTTGSREILIDPDVGFAIGKSPLFTVDAQNGSRTLDATNASMWVDYAGNLHVKGEINATSLFIGDETAEDYMASHATKIRLNATRISWASQYSTMTEDGKLTCKGATIDGSLVCVTPDTYVITYKDSSNTNVLDSKVTMQFKNGKLDFKGSDGQESCLFGRLSFDNSGFNIAANSDMTLRGTGDVKISSTTGKVSISSQLDMNITCHSVATLSLNTAVISVTTSLEMKANQMVHIGLKNGNQSIEINSHGLDVVSGRYSGTGFTGTIREVYKVNQNGSWYNDLQFVNGILVGSRYYID